MRSRVRAWFEENPDGIAAAYLFGSVARGEGGPKSDVDVGVLFEVEPPSVLASPAIRIEGELERELGRRCQVVALNAAPVDLAIRVMRAGVLLLDHDRSARIRFEVRTRNEFWDLEPLLRRYRRQETRP